MYSAIGVEPTKLTACTRGSCKQRIDRFLVAIDEIEYAVRQARFLEQPVHKSAVRSGLSQMA